MVLQRRQYGTIGFSSIRGGDIVGERNSMLLREGERLSSSTSQTWPNFTRGAFVLLYGLEEQVSLTL